MYLSMFLLRESVSSKLKTKEKNMFLTNVGLISRRVLYPIYSFTRVPLYYCSRFFVSRWNDPYLIKMMMLTNLRIWSEYAISVILGNDTAVTMAQK